MKKFIILLFFIIWSIAIFLYENRNLFISIKLNNQAISLYNSWSYELSNKIFSWALEENNDSIILYNIWNSLFKIWESDNNIEEKIKWYQVSLEAYSGSLDLRYNKDTQENYEYVKNKFDELLESKNQDDNSQNNNQEDSQEWEADDTNSEKNTSEQSHKNESSTEENQSTESTENEKNNEENEGNQGNKDSNTNEKSEENQQSQWEETNELSQEQMEQIEQYAENLKKSEFYNQKYFNKQEPEDNQNIDDFFRDPFFDDSFVRWWEKDW